MILNDGKEWSKMRDQNERISKLKEIMDEAESNLNIEFPYKEDWYVAAGGEGAVYWCFYKNGEEVGDIEGFENVFTYKFIDGKSILDVFDEIEPDIEFD